MTSTGTYWSPSMARGIPCRRFAGCRGELERDRQRGRYEREGKRLLIADRRVPTAVARAGEQLRIDRGSIEAHDSLLAWSRGKAVCGLRQPVKPMEATRRAPRKPTGGGPQRRSSAPLNFVRDGRWPRPDSHSFADAACRCGLTANDFVPTELPLESGGPITSRYIRGGSLTRSR